MVFDFNTLRSRLNGHHYTDDIFECVFLNENILISIKISLNFVPEGQINCIPALVQIMAWRRPGAKPVSELMVFVPRRIYASPGLNELITTTTMYNTCVIHLQWFGDDSKLLVISCGQHHIASFEWQCHFSVIVILTHWAETKWPAFHRRHLQMHCIEWTCKNFDYDFTEGCF